MGKKENIFLIEKSKLFQKDNVLIPMYKNIAKTKHVHLNLKYLHEFILDLTTQLTLLTEDLGF